MRDSGPALVTVEWNTGTSHLTHLLGRFPCVENSNLPIIHALE